MTKKATKSGKVTLPLARLSWPALDKPSTQFNENNYKATFLIPKEDEKGVAQVRAELKKVAVEHWGGKLPDGFHSPLKDGDALADENEKKSSYRGYWVIDAKSPQRPPLCVGPDRQLKPATDFYGGCWVRGLVVFSSYVKGSNQGITTYLQGVQFCKDGDPFGGGAVMEDFEEFETVEDFFNEGDGADFPI